MRQTASKRSAKRPAKPKAVSAADSPSPAGHNRPPIEPLVVRPAQAARLLSISERTIWTHIAARRLEVSRIGNLTLVHMTSIRALLDATAGKAPRVVPVHS